MMTTSYDYPRQWQGAPGGKKMFDAPSARELARVAGGGCEVEVDGTRSWWRSGRGQGTRSIHPAAHAVPRGGPSRGRWGTQMVKKQKLAAQRRSRSLYNGGYAGAKGRRKTKRNCNKAKSVDGGCCPGNHQEHQSGFHRRMAGACQAKLDACRAELDAHQQANSSVTSGPPATATTKAHTATWPTVTTSGALFGAALDAAAASADAWEMAREQARHAATIKTERRAAEAAAVQQAAVSVRREVGQCTNKQKWHWQWAGECLCRRRVCLGGKR